jgi:hypothetical protein
MHEQAPFDITDFLTSASHGAGAPRPCRKRLRKKQRNILYAAKMNYSLHHGLTVHV